MASFYEQLNKQTVADDKENALSRKSVDKWIFRLLLVLIGFMPLIVMAKVVEITSPIISTNSELSSGYLGDLFTYYKSLVIIAITFISSLLLIAKILFMGGTIRKTVINYFLVIFSFVIVISTILSPSITIALNGHYNRTDGAVSWLCYIALFFIAININYPKQAIKAILFSLYPFVLINLFIMTMNFYGKDLLQYTKIQNLVSLFLPEGANLSAGSTLVGTLNQWNYMSGMFGIMAVLFLGAALYEKNTVQRIGHLVIALASMAMIFMSISSSGFLAFLVLLPFLVAALIMVTSKKQVAIVLAAFLLLTAPVLHVLASHSPVVWEETIGIFIKSNPYAEKQTEVVTSSQMNFNYLLTNKAYAADVFELPVLPESATASGSGRLYIWEKTFDLVKDKPLFGYGLDSLMYNFPHYTIDARGGLGSEDIITDKAHSLYMSLLYGTGFIGLISLLAIVISSIISAIKVAVKIKNAPIFILGAAWCAYLVQALFNDSLPSLTTVAFVLAGMMIGMTLQSKESEDVRNN
ncbi:O-antigen ligase family protein [Metasolibacillus sp. FSL K6-0083]|uniref:O-antigen ligase family protein n=1 Tax=Metasolibacillus sp. FSL K6-0083 TaxID=2921416 RepID=UPI00315AE244